ncbi:MAG: DNA (cytosine-5-)-methyltransferase [Deltaproteobacteria bacterium]|jgi:DNA (cytosine-5)-methyltransferase 1|nr:DNA (cytosine-5-)-methyltransferase [Deltaproteobacteria bacterium]
MSFKYIDLFAGIGGFHQAASLLSGQCVFASEINDEARKAYSLNYGFSPAGDITKINAKDIPDHDFLFAGFPCQPFSIIGNQLGFNDIRGTLFFEIARILKEKQPNMFILENVKQLTTHNNGMTLNVILDQLQKCGYKVFWSVLNALDFNLPQKRERIIIVGFLNNDIDFIFPNIKSHWDLKSILESDEDIDPKHFVSAHILQKRLSKHQSMFNPAIWHENKSGNISSYPYSCALRAGASYNYLLVNGKRRLTPREMLRLQGFSDSFKIVCSDFQTRRQAGNAVPVNIIAAVLQAMIEIKNKIKP